MTSTVPVPIVKHITGYGTDAVASARNGLFFVAAFVPGGGERVYQFRVTREGRVSGFSALPGGVLGRGQWEASTLAATPDGSRVAVAFTFVGSNAPDADYIVGIDTATGARTVWRGTARDLGGASFTVQNLSWTAGRPGTGVPRAVVPRGHHVHERDLPVRFLGGGGPVARPGGGGPLDSGRMLLRQSARFPYLAQALISPDGAALTAVVLRGAVVGSHAVSGAAPDNLSVEMISVATGQNVATLYHRRLGPTSQIVGAPHFLVLSADAAREHWLLNGGISGGGRLQQRVQRVDPPRPADTAVAPRRRGRRRSLVTRLRRGPDAACRPAAMCRPAGQGWTARGWVHFRSALR